MEPPPDLRAKLRAHFDTLPPTQQAPGWEAMWAQKITPWDRDRPNPALIDTLATHPHLIRDPFGSEQGKVDASTPPRKKALVPGCGRGHDVLLFASCGFDAWGLDASATAVGEARKLVARQDEGGGALYPVRDPEVGGGTVRFLEADFFDDAFLAETHEGQDGNRGFDLIYDYTFLCALPPSLRPKWAARMSQLLAREGRVITLEFPLGKEPSTGGPPHGLSHVLYEKLFNKPGEEVEYDANGYAMETSGGEKSAAALERIDTWVPDRTFEGQEKSSMVSVWRHAKS